jgi:putative lipoic acid-binding regulatory protein
MKPNVPSKELLEASHQFPGPYVFKVIGHHEPAFVARVVAAVREELQMEVDPNHEKRESAQGNHVSVTILVRVPSAEHVRSVYFRLLKMPGLIMLL